MNKLIGYIIALIGLAVILVSFNVAKFPFLASINKTYIMIAGLVLVVLGVVFSLNKPRTRIKHAEEEVPIYAGTGKKRRIVGYRKD